MGWWEKNNMRMVQFNLQQEDAAADVAAIIKQLKQWHANTVMTGAGGITAYYPTDLPYHYRSPYLGSRDMLGDMVRLCHEASIRVIARFDFSKIHESIANEHPDWLYRDLNGNIINYHSMVHTCLSGAYQWEHAEDILRECLTRYAIDGIYINMFGYHTWDYDGVNHGLCHCENCRLLFETETGLPYPRTSGNTQSNGPIVEGDSETFQAVRLWQQRRVHDILNRVYRLVKEINPEISVCTHTNETCVDMTHTESNTALKRPLPLWAYSSFDNVRLTNDQQNGIWSANCCINAADIGWRFTGVSPAFNRAKLWQQIAAGGQPEWCIVGTPEHYPDRSNFHGLSDVFAFHEANERYLGQRRSLANIAVVRISDSFPPDDGRMDEYRGVVRALKEEHYQFDIITEENVGRLAANYKLLILPDSRVDAIDIPESCHLIATGHSFRDNADALRDFFGAEYVRTEEKTLGAYLFNNNKSLFKRMPERDWLLLTESIDLYHGEGVLPYMAPGVFGPVEIAGGVFPSEYKAALLQEKEGIKRILLPWWPGRMYTRYGYDDQKYILLDLIDSILGTPDVLFHAPDMVDAYYDGIPDGRLIQLVNLTGFNGVSVHEPVPVHDITVNVPANSWQYAVDLRTGQEIHAEYREGRLLLHIPVLTDYTAILLPEEKKHENPHL